MSSIKDLKRMCNTSECSKCDLLEWCEEDGRISELPDNVDSIVYRWVKTHPPKTYAMDFLKNFPNAQVDRYKTPKLCRNIIYDNGCPKQCNIVSSCVDCWNMEMKEDD